MTPKPRPKVFLTPKTTPTATPTTPRLRTNTGGPVDDDTGPRENERGDKIESPGIFTKDF